MGSLSNPIGPLPSSIYWRRRAVALAVLAGLVLLVVWAFSLSGGEKDDQGKNGGDGPVGTITPGPTDSGPAISERPGGRDEGGSGGGAGTGSGGSGDAGTGGSSGGAGPGSDGGDSGWQIPAGKPGSGDGPKLPDCTATDVHVTVRSMQAAYGPGEQPEFELKAENTGGADCGIDLSAPSTVVQVTDAEEEGVWSSADCRREAEPAFVPVPAKDSVTRTFVWGRKPSVPDCGTPPAGSSPAGSYSVEIEVGDFKKAYATFALKKG